MRIKRKHFLVAILIVALTLALNVIIVSAGPGVPGHWHSKGGPDPALCDDFHDCTLVKEICVDGNTTALGSWTTGLWRGLIGTIDGATNGACAIAPSWSTPVFVYGFGSCKLLDIDEAISWSSNFHAEWLGNLVSVRFRDGAGNTVFVPPVSSHFEDGHRAGYFNVYGAVEPGHYEATCFGATGTVGTAMDVTVTQ